jgi:hypothetical protein
MFRFGCVSALALAAALVSSSAYADGAIAVGSTADVVHDGIAIGTSVNYKSADEAVDAALQRCRNYKPAPKAAVLCQSVGSFKNECYAISFDPKPGTPGAGWAIAATKELAEQRALTNCKITAGADRVAFCKVEEVKCDGS